MHEISLKEAEDLTPGMNTDDFFKTAIGRQLYGLLPEVYRTRDSGSADDTGDLARNLTDATCRRRDQDRIFWLQPAHSLHAEIRRQGSSAQRAHPVEGRAEGEVERVELLGWRDAACLPAKPPLHPITSLEIGRP